MPPIRFPVFISGSPGYPHVVVSVLGSGLPGLGFGVGLEIGTVGAEAGTDIVSVTERC